jgi:hypothetical protein
MARKQAPPVSELQKAMEFLDLINTPYCVIENGTGVAFDSIVAAGVVIQEDINAAPVTSLMALAIAQAGLEFQIVHFEGYPAKKLQVTAPAFQAFIDCENPERIPRAIPDAPLGPINDNVATGLRIVGSLANAKGETVAESCVQLNNSSVVGTDNSVALEYWHGCNMPDGLLVPKQAIAVVAKVKKRMTQFGFSKNTLTFWYEDGSWIRTNLYTEKYPDIRTLINRPTQPRDVPKTLFAAAKRIAPFSHEGRLFICNGYISSHPNVRKNHVGSEMEYIGDQHEPRTYLWDHLKLIAKLVTQWDEVTNEYATYFFGENLRGAIASSPLRNQTGDETSDEGTTITDDDIPF